MEPHARYTLVGAVIIAAVACLTVILVWLSKRGVGDATTVYVVYFHQHSSAGLQKDGTVTMRGIKVGTVRSLGIPEKDIEAVRVEINIDATIPVKTDTRAVIQRNLLTGLASIDLVGTSQRAERLAKPHPGERYPVIPEGQDGLSQLQSTLPEAMQRAQEVLDGAREIVGPENREALAVTLRNLKELTNALAAQDEELDAALSSVHHMANELANLATELRTESGPTLAAIRELVEEMRRQGNRVGNSMNATVSKFGRTAETFEDPRRALFGPAPDQRGPGE